MNHSKPIPDHPFHAKSDASLRYIVKDASEAAAAMRGHSPDAELRYLDQVNDACTVLGYRARICGSASVAKLAFPALADAALALAAC